jgi:bifunctional lysine-specific demethylase and histidyl-hydroxylase NO66
VHRATRHSIVEALLAAAADEPALRAGFPLGIDVSDPQQLQPHLDDTIKSLQAMLDTIHADIVAAALRRSQSGDRRPAAVRPLAQASAADDLQSDHVVRLLPCLRPILTGEGDILTLYLPDRTITMPATCVSAVRAILNRLPIRVGDLPGLDGPDQLVFARRLLREAVVVPFAAE